MRFRYCEWDGSEFSTQDHLDFFNQYVDFILEYGDEAMQALHDLEENEDHAELLEKLIREGLLEKVGARWKLTPRAINSMQRQALMEVFSQMQSGHRGSHDTQDVGRGGERTDGTKPYQFGDPVSDIDMHRTLRNALARNGVGTPIQMREQDFELHCTESRAATNLVILLDMSGSMFRMNRFTNAKKCAMALTALVQQRFPEDTVDIVGFYSGATQIPEHKLPLLLPKRVSIYDPVVRMRVPIDQVDDAPQHFTNLQMGLMLARRVLLKRGAENQQIFIITDGQPTAHVENGFVHLLYPPEQRTAIATLKEAMLCVQADVRISTFALIDDYYYMDWVGFVDQLTKLTKGIAFYCHASDLSSCVMESYLSGKKKKAFLG